MTWLKKAVKNSRLVKNSTLAFTAVAVLCCSWPLQAWTAKGHRYITEHAFVSLDTQTRDYYFSLVKTFDLGDKARIKNRTKKTSINKASTKSTELRKWLYLSHFPDVIRFEKMGELFARYDAPLPTLLLPFTDQSSTSWHYYNATTDPTDPCQPRHRGKLLPALELIHKALAEPLLPQQEVLLLSFQMHFLQDLHQPMHTFTHLRKGDCRSDRGGNLTCVKTKPKSRECAMNLHLLWDFGFGVFDGNFVDKPRLKHDEDHFAPYLWLQESASFYDKAYQFNRRGYQTWAKGVTQERVSLAVHRLQTYLQLHQRVKTSHDK